MLGITRYVWATPLMAGRNASRWRQKFKALSSALLSAVAHAPFSLLPLHSNNHFRIAPMPIMYYFPTYPLPISPWVLEALSQTPLTVKLTWLDANTWLTPAERRLPC